MLEIQSESDHSFMNLLGQYKGGLSVALQPYKILKLKNHIVSWGLQYAPQHFEWDL